MFFHLTINLVEYLSIHLLYCNIWKILSSWSWLTHIYICQLRCNAPVPGKMESGRRTQCTQFWKSDGELSGDVMWCNGLSGGPTVVHTLQLAGLGEGANTQWSKIRSKWGEVCCTELSVLPEYDWPRSGREFPHSSLQPTRQRCAEQEDGRVCNAACKRKCKCKCKCKSNGSIGKAACKRNGSIGKATCKSNGSRSESVGRGSPPPLPCPCLHTTEGSASDFEKPPRQVLPSVLF